MRDDEAVIAVVVFIDRMHDLSPDLWCHIGRVNVADLEHIHVAEALHLRYVAQQLLRGQRRLQTVLCLHRGDRAPGT